MAGLLHDLGYDASLFSLHSLCREGGHSSLPAGPGPDRHQMSGTMDQRHLLAVHHFFLCCHFTPCRGTCPHHPSHYHPLHLLLATHPPLHAVIVRSPYGAPPLITTVVIISYCGNHALSGFSNLALSCCSESQHRFVGLRLIIMDNLG